MDDLAPQKKKRLGMIRKLGKFLGMGGSASKSETKSQIDDFEELDPNHSPNNGIDSIMALTPEQRALPLFLLNEEDFSPSVSPSPTSAAAGGFKPKSIPTSLSRVPGRSSLSPRNPEPETPPIPQPPQFSQQKPHQSQLPTPLPTPTPPPPQPPQRVEDIIRQKIPFNRRNSKLNQPESVEERIESKEIRSPVCHPSIHDLSPATHTDQKLHIQTILSEPEEKNHDPISPTTRLTPTLPTAESSKNLPDNTYHNNNTTPILKSMNSKIKVIQMTLDLSSDSLDHSTNSPEEQMNQMKLSNEESEVKNEMNKPHNVVVEEEEEEEEDDALRCTSFDVNETKTHDCSIDLNTLSCDSEDSLTAKITQTLLKEPMKIKTKHDFRAEFLTFRQNSKTFGSRSDSTTSEVENKNQEEAGAAAAAGGAGGAAAKLNGKMEQENENENDDDTISSYASDEIQSVISSDNEEDQTKPPVMGQLESLSISIYRTDSIPEGDENNSDDEMNTLAVKKALSHSRSTDNSSDTSVMDFKVTAIAPKNVNSTTTKLQKNKRMSVGGSHGTDSGTTSGNKLTKQRSKSIVTNQLSAAAVMTPSSSFSSSTSTSSASASASASSSSSSLTNASPINGTWNSSIQSKPSSSTTASSSSSSSSSNQSTKSIQKTRRHSTNPNAPLISTTSSNSLNSTEKNLRTPPRPSPRSSTSSAIDGLHLSSSSSFDSEYSDIKITKLSSNSGRLNVENKRKSVTSGGATGGASSSGGAAALSSSSSSSSSSSKFNSKISPPLNGHGRL